jgi:hypothetical protein
MRTETAAFLIEKDRIFIGQRKAGRKPANLSESRGGKLEEGAPPLGAFAMTKSPHKGNA